MLIMKSEKRQMREGTELPNKKIRTLGQKKTYKYLEILDEVTIKQAGVKEKIKRNTRGERESYSKPNYI